jgi:sugar lactone lactonase YvrE
MKNLVFFLMFILYLLINSILVRGQIIVTFAGKDTTGYSGDGGQATLAKLKTPSGVAVDKFGSVYITDQNASCVRKVDTFGIITSIVGNSGIAGYSGDGGPATNSELNWPQGLAIDNNGNIFIADQFNNLIRKVTIATGTISTIAGNHALIGYSGDGGPATNAALWHPADVAVDRNGNVYFVDQDNSVMRKIDVVSGVITTMAGTGTSGYSGDGGPATAAQLNFPQGIVVDTIGNIYIADFYNSRIRKINAITGVINTVAGNGLSGYSGDGGEATNAQLYDASALAIDDSGNIFISDYYNSMIRKVNAATGIITTIAGNGTAAWCCDCHNAIAAEIYYPQGVAVDKIGNVYIADFGNGRVRKVTNVFSCPSLEIKEKVLEPIVSVFPNPSCGRFCIQINNIQNQQKAEIYNIIGQKVYDSNISELQTNIDLSSFPAGIYFLHSISGSGNKVINFAISY